MATLSTSPTTPNQVTAVATRGDRRAADANRVGFVYASYGYGTVDRYDHRIDRFADVVTLVG